MILDRINKTAAKPASDDEAKQCFRIVTNINDKPEIHNWGQTVDVFEGEYVRADDLTSIPNLEIEFGAVEISDDFDSISEGDYLVFTTDGPLAVNADPSEYKVYFEVIAKTGYLGKGVLAIIRVNDIAVSTTSSSGDETEGG